MTTPFIEVSVRVRGYVATISYPAPRTEKKDALISKVTGYPTIDPLVVEGDRITDVIFRTEKAAKAMASKLKRQLGRKIKGLSVRCWAIDEEMTPMEFYDRSRIISHQGVRTS